jgi:hypothetical protein
MKPTPITMKHIETIIHKLAPTIDEKSEEAYDKFKENAMDYRPSYVG